MDAYDAMAAMVLMMFVGACAGYAAGKLSAMNKYIPEICEARSEIARLKAMMRLSAGGQDE